MRPKDQDENMAARFAEMDQEERKQFEEGRRGRKGDKEGGEEEFAPENPRDEDRMGRHNQPESEERAAEKATEMKEAGPE